MDVHIRTESQEDHEEVIRLTEAAFKNMPFSNQQEGILVRKLRKGPNFVRELSIVAEHEGKIVGHILFTKIIIERAGNIYKSLILAPVSVLPEFQRKGIGSKLIYEGLGRAKTLGFKSVIVVGHADYYPRFGFQKASLFNIDSSIEVPEDVFMVMELAANGLKNVSGTVIYPDEFKP